MSPHIPVSGLLLRAREAMRVAVQEQEQWPSWPGLGPGGLGPDAAQLQNSVGRE